MCKHEFTQEEWIVEVCKNCGKLQQEIELEQQLAAANARIKILETELERNFLGEIKANARVAELEKDNARQKRLATISRLCKNVAGVRAEKAEEKIRQMEDAIKFVQQQAATIEALEKTIVKRCQYHRKNDAHRCPYNSKGCMDWELCNKHFHDCGKEWQVKEGQG